MLTECKSDTIIGVMEHCEYCGAEAELLTGYPYKFFNGIEIQNNFYKCPQCGNKFNVWVSAEEMKKNKEVKNNAGKLDKD